MSKITAFGKKINEKIYNSRSISELRHRIKTRDKLRFTKTKDGNKYRVSKRLKYQVKQIRGGLLKKLCAKPMSLIDLMLRIGIYKKTLALKLLFILFPFIILLITDGFVISVVVATIDIFLCALIFSITTTERKEAIVNGKFDYGKYKTIKAKKETISILLMFFVAMMLTIIGHFILEKLLQTMSGIVIE